MRTPKETVSTISSSFIYDFKLGDNIAYNLEIIGVLYALRATAGAEQTDALRKPIIVLNVSIIEAVLYDFFNKIKVLTLEGVPNLPIGAEKYWKKMNIDKLEVFIAQARKQNLFTEPSEFYDQLDELRKLRNRVHIQNEKYHFEPDDHIAFSKARLIESEKAVEKVLVKMANDHPREHDHVRNFIIPWGRHFP